MRTPHWIEAHINTFEFPGAAAAIVVTDSLRSAVSWTHRYEPEISRTYAEVAATTAAIMPAGRRGPLFSGAPVLLSRTVNPPRTFGGSGTRTSPAGC